MIFKHEINMNLATEGFRVVSLESPQKTNSTAKDADNHFNDHSGNAGNNINGSLYNSLSHLEQYLSDADCKEFMDGLENTIHDGELLYEHVTDFTAKILRKWGAKS